MPKPQARLKGLDVKKPYHFLKKNGKVFEQLPPTLDHEVIQHFKSND